MEVLNGLFHCVDTNGWFQFYVRRCTGTKLHEKNVDMMNTFTPNCILFGIFVYFCLAIKFYTGIHHFGELVCKHLSILSYRSSWRIQFGICKWENRTGETYTFIHILFTRVPSPSQAPDRKGRKLLQQKTSNKQRTTTQMHLCIHKLAWWTGKHFKGCQRFEWNLLSVSFIIENNLK